MRISRPVLALVTLAGALGVARADDEPAFTQGRLALDRSFGRRGMVHELRAGTRRVDGVARVAVDSRGRVVVAGVAELAGDAVGPGASVPVVARLRSDGRLDATYGEGGLAAPPVFGRLTDFALDAQDRAVLVGEWSPWEGGAPAAGYLALRLTAEGALDERFSSDGLLEADEATGMHDLTSVRAAPDGSVLALAARRMAFPVGATVRGLVRLHAGGIFDSAYGLDGVADLVDVTSLDVDSEGRAVVCERRGVSRLTAGGQPDAAFAGGELARGPHGGGLHGLLAVDGADRVLVLGQELDDAGRTLARGVFRVRADGTLDTAFAGRGWAEVPLALPADVEPHGSRFVASRDGARCAFASTFDVRVSPSGRVDGTGWFVQTFDAAHPLRMSSLVRREPRRAGRVELGVGALAVDADGKVVAGGVRRVARGGELVSTVPLLARVDAGSDVAVALPDVRPAWRSVRVRKAPLDPLFRFSATFVVRNEGRGLAPDAEVRVVVSRDDVMDAGDTVIARRFTGPLPPGGSRTLRVATPYVGVRDGLTLEWAGEPDLAGWRLLAAVDADRTRIDGDRTDDVAAFALE